MPNYIRPIDSTIKALLPTDSTPTKFDKVVELIKALSANSIPGAIAQAIETTGKVCSVIVSGNQRVKAVKYVADAYEVRCLAEVELARINLKQQQNQAVMLYIEKSFQERMDQLNREFILKSKELCMEHTKSMHEIDLAHKREIQRINLIAQEHMHQIDNYYTSLIIQNENYCMMYRQYLQSLIEQDITPAKMIRDISIHSLDVMSDLSRDMRVTDSRIQIVCDTAIRMVETIGNMGDGFISFESFIEKKRKYEDLGNADK